MDKKYYVGEKPKHRKLQYILLVPFTVFLIGVLVSIGVSGFTSYDLGPLPYVLLILGLACGGVSIILGICEPQPLYQWSTKKCLGWLYAHRPEEELRPAVIYSGGDYIITYIKLDSSGIYIERGWNLEETLRASVYKINEENVKEK